MSEQATQDRANSTLAWRLIGVLSLLGLAIATYLMINYARNQTPYCAGSDGCGIVQASEYVTIITGLLDIPTLGVAGCIILLVLTMFRGRLNEQVEFYLPLLTYGAALIGFLYSLYLGSRHMIGIAAYTVSGYFSINFGVSLQGRTQ